MFDYNKNTSYSAPNLALLNQWKCKLLNKEIQLVESGISTMLVERNYQLSNLPLIKVIKSEKRKLKLQCWLSRMKQNGLSLFVADYIARRLKISS